MNFVWDPKKATQNLRKHGASFDQAAEAFDDNYVFSENLDKDGEQRHQIIGETDA